MSNKVLGILASGRGSNLQSIIDAIEAGSLSASIGVVISDKPNAFSLERAAKHNIPVFCIERKAFVSKDDFENAILAKLKEYNSDLVILAGYMRIIGSQFINNYEGRIMNIHPSLLPSFPGLHAHEQTIAYGAKVSGCTVHFVDEGMDSGPIILQEAVAVLDSDSADTLSERILVVEHKLYPKAIQLYCDNRLFIDGRMVKVLAVD